MRLAGPARAATRAAVNTGAALAVASLALSADNLRRARVPDPTARPAPEPVCVLLPVRDEERHVVPCVTALLASLDRYPGPARLVVLDDGSTDATARLLADLAADDPRVEVARGAPLPEGWAGKPWACHQLARRAGDARVLVFVDADVTVAPPALAATVALLRDAGLDLVCPYPRQLAEGIAERLIQPLLAWSWMSTLPLGLAETSTRPSLGAANGQLLAVDAAAYTRLGGHAAVRAEVLEDLALLRALKAVGGRGVVAEGSRVATCRMYHGWAELRAGYGKSLWTAFGSAAGAAGVLGLLGLVHVLPAAAAMVGSRAGLVGYAAGVASRALVARRTGGRVVDAVAHPVSVGLLGLLTADSVRARRRGTLRWKGRPVAAREPGPEAGG